MTALTVVGSDAALGLIFGGIRVEAPIVEHLPFASPAFAGLILACTVAAPTGIAAYLTLGSHRQADSAVRIAAALLTITTLAALVAVVVSLR